MENEQAAQVNCANGCGFFGNPSTSNMCSKCFREHAKADLRPATPTTPAPALAPALVAVHVSSSRPSSPRAPVAAPPALVACAPPAADVPEPKVQKNTSRCFSCRKKIGLTGFQCRCHFFFCSEHRYSDKHECDFDYKGHGQAILEKANPVVVASKIDMI